ERGTTEGRQKTKEYIKSVLVGYGYKPEMHSYRKNGDNIFTILNAETTTDEYILVGAHMDSVKNMGADDNATGSSAVLEASRVLKELKGRKVNIIFAWFDEEELGLVGSYAMAKDFKKKGMKITSVHTMDMVGYDSDKDNNMEIEQPDGILWDYYNMVNKNHNLNFPLIRTNGGDTDHVAFRETGFEAVGICEEWYHGDTTPEYHKKTDTYQTLNFDFITNVTKLVSAVVGDLSLQVAAPTNIVIKKHNLYPSRKRAHFHSSYDEIK
ncbi:MAG: M28 family metallopeptidase, partial [Cyanobacteriota bacterium]